MLLALAAAGCSSTARAAPTPWRRAVLVELYTSQGCSSCPPADAFVRELPALGLGPDKVIPLTFHVDYWDDLGWPDPFADGAYTARQGAYARAFGSGGLYTPQMIVNGTDEFVGSDRRRAATAIAAALTEAATTPLALSVADTAGGAEHRVVVDYQAERPPPRAVLGIRTV